MNGLPDCQSELEIERILDRDLLCVCQLVNAFVAAMRPALNVSLSFLQYVGCCTLECIPITTVAENEQISQNGINCPEFSGITFQVS
jgi:hypothetical protein